MLHLQVSRVLVGIVITLEVALLINRFLSSGKTCMLYYILILCVIRSQPIVFGEVCVPHWYLFETNLRVLLVSSPRSRPDRKWLTQSVGEDTNAVFLVKPWSRENFLVAMFVYITLNLFALSYI